MDPCEAKGSIKKRGMSLAELIVGLCLFSIAIIPLFGIIPTAYMSIKKAEDFSAASCYAQEIIEIYRQENPSFTGYNFHRRLDPTLNGTDYHVDLDVYDIHPGVMIDVVINIYWKRIPEHISVFSRMYYNE
jgi:hypothetical protein